jgi:hypothetical protein
MAIEAIKRGEKPVLTVANTMEAFLKDYADNLGLKPGDDMPGDFGHVLRKYLDRTRTILIKKPFMKKGEKPERHYLTDDELGPAGVAAYKRAMAIIDSMDLSRLPLSPIDYIKGKIRRPATRSARSPAGRWRWITPATCRSRQARSGSEKTARGRTARSSASTPARRRAASTRCHQPGRLDRTVGARLGRPSTTSPSGA